MVKDKVYKDWCGDSTFERFFSLFDKGCLASGCMGSTRQGKELGPLLLAFPGIWMVRGWKQLGPSAFLLRLQRKIVRRDGVDRMEGMNATKR